MARAPRLSDSHTMFQGAFGSSGVGRGLPLRPRTRLVLLLALVAAILLLGCGKRGEPLPPGPAEAVTWPRDFPRDPPPRRPEGTLPAPR